MVIPLVLERSRYVTDHVDPNDRGSDLDDFLDDEEIEEEEPSSTGSDEKKKRRWA